MQKEADVEGGERQNSRGEEVQASSRMIKTDDGAMRSDAQLAVMSGVTSSSACPVNSWNEWDPLQEVIVGRLDGAVIPPFHVSVTHNNSYLISWLHRLFVGHRYPQWMVRRAQSELDGFIRLLEAESVRVRRPEPIVLTRHTRTRLWSSKGFCLACPRDIFLVVGDEIVETPTC